MAAYWTITKKANVVLGFGTSTGVLDGCTDDSKKLAIIYVGTNTQPILNCITAGQTNESLPLSNTTSYNRYSFTNNVWDARDWQVKSTQNFTNYGQKIVGCYNCFQESGCAGGQTTSIHFILPRINATFVSDNGNSCTIRLNGDSQTKLGTTSRIKVYQEISGVWTEIATTAIIPIGVQSNLNGYVPTTNVTINSNQSNVPIHFKSSIVPLESLQFTGLSFPLTVFAYKIANSTYTPTTTITAANVTALATALNADLAARTGLPTTVKDSYYMVYSGNLILSNPIYDGTLAHYQIITNSTQYSATSNLNTMGTNETWADMWLECKYNYDNQKYKPTQNADLVTYGKQYCKITNDKCVGRFNNLTMLENQADAQLVKILATNDNFFTSLLS
jgi:hypothetical protein